MDDPGSTLKDTFLCRFGSIEDRRRNRAGIGNLEGRLRRRHEYCWVGIVSTKLEIFGNLIDRLRTDLILVCRTCDEQRIITNHIDQPGNAVGKKRDALNRGTLKNRRAAVARRSESKSDVSSDLLVAERHQPRPQSDPLPEMIERRTIEAGFEFQLTDQHQLQQSCAGMLQIREQSQLFDHLIVEVLSLIEQ